MLNVKQTRKKIGFYERKETADGVEPSAAFMGFSDLYPISP